MSYVDPIVDGGMPVSGGIVGHQQADDEIVDIELHQTAINTEIANRVAGDTTNATAIATANSNITANTTAITTNASTMNAAISAFNNYTSTALSITDARYRSAYGTDVVEFHINEHGADPTGTNDSTTAFTICEADAANARTNGAPQAYIVGDVGSYKLAGGNLTSTDANIGLVGPGQNAMKIIGTGTGTLFSRNNTANWSSSTTNYAAKLGGFSMDGTSMGTVTACAGIQDIDVMAPWYEDIYFVNFNGPIGTGNASTGRTAGLWQYLTNWWSERAEGRRLTFKNCSVGHLQDGGTSTSSTGQGGGTAGADGPASFDYSYFRGMNFSVHAGQIGRYVINSASCVGGSYEGIVNATLSSGSALYLMAIGIIGASADSSNVINAFINMVGETDGSGSTAYDINISAVSGFINHGVFALSGTWSAPSGMIYANGVFSGECNMPSFGRPIYTATSPSASSTGKSGLWTCNNYNTFGMRMPSAMAPGTAGVTIYSGVGTPTFSATAGDLYINSTGGVNTYLYRNAGTTTWSALSV